MAESAHQFVRGEARGDDACRLGITWEICADGFTCAVYVQDAAGRTFLPGAYDTPKNHLE